MLGHKGDGIGTAQHGYGATLGDRLAFNRHPPAYASGDLGIGNQGWKSICLSLVTNFHLIAGTESDIRPAGTPHHLAAQAGRRVLEDGGNAIESMIAAAATITVVYPHMNAMGGDNFWLIHTPGKDVTGIDACGGAAGAADIAFYRDKGLNAIPSRGNLAALTVAGAVSGWQAALEVSRKEWDGRLPLARLLEDAVFYAEDGVAVT